MRFIPVTPGLFKRQVLNRFWWVIHPVSVFVFIQILWATILTLWVIWFIGRRREIERLASHINPGILHTDDTSAVVLIIIGAVMLSLLGAGTILLFTWGQRQSSLMQQQRQFVSSVTHELRTPLASLHLAYETLSSRKLDEGTQKKILSMSLGDINRLIRLVNQILISSRLDRGLSMFKEDLMECAMASTIVTTLEGLTYLDPNILERTSIDCEANLTWFGSQSALKIIFGNLLENAVKYSPLKTPIHISAQSVSNYIRIEIKDQGLGLSRRDRKKIFRMFYRSGDATMRAIPGTGLGLFIVKTTLEQLGGEIKVDSPGLGQGTTFRVTLPL